MKQIIFFSFIFFFISFYVSYATTPPATMPEIPKINVNIWEILDRALNWFFGIALAIAVIMLVYAGFNYVTAGGNEDKIRIASKTIIFALIGVVIALLAKGIPIFIQNFLEGKSSSSSSLNNETPLNAENILIEQAQDNIPNLSKVCDCSSGSLTLEDWCNTLSDICKSLCCGAGGNIGAQYFGFAD
jgi:hypothetical protein